MTTGPGIRPALFEEEPVDVRIGVSDSPKELEVELPEDVDRDALTGDIEKSISDGTMVWLTDRRGRRVGIPAAKIAYVDLGPADSDRRIGFQG